MECLAQVSRNIAKRQPNQLGRGLIGWEMPPRLNDLAHPRVHTLNRIGRIEVEVGLPPISHQRKLRDTCAPRGGFAMRLPHSSPRP